jgi:hypothetical protein
MKSELEDVRQHTAILGCGITALVSEMRDVKHLVQLLLTKKSRYIIDGLEPQTFEPQLCEQVASELARDVCHRQSCSSTSVRSPSFSSPHARPGQPLRKYLEPFLTCLIFGKCL